MIECDDCGQKIKSKKGLGLHRRAKHPSKHGGTNVAAVAVTLAELERSGRLETVDTARVQAVRSIAQALDVNPFNSQMWREYREALERLTADDDDDGSVAELLAELSSTVRHPKAP